MTIIVDTGVLIAAADTDDTDHDRCAAVLRDHHGELHVPAPVIPDADGYGYGYGWALLSEARVPARVAVGRMLLAGNSQAIAVVRVVAVDDDGQVHFAVLPGPVNKNQHLLDHASA